MNTDKFTKEVSSRVGSLTIFIAIMIVGAAMNGWALTMLWRWFVVPVFHLPILSLVQAIGIGMVAKFLTRHAIDTEQKDKDKTTIIAEKLAKVIFYPIFVVGIGYIVALFL